MYDPTKRELVAGKPQGCEVVQKQRRILSNGKKQKKFALSQLILENISIRDNKFEKIRKKVVVKQGISNRIE